VEKWLLFKAFDESLGSCTLLTFIWCTFFQASPGPLQLDVARLEAMPFMLTQRGRGASPGQYPSLKRLLGGLGKISAIIR